MFAGRSTRGYGEFFLYTNTVLIRTENPTDALEIDKLLRQVFGRDDEALLVHKLREDGLLTLSAVIIDDEIEDENAVVGYAAFSQVDVAGEDRHWVGLAPLAVAESYRRQGLGKKLVFASLDMLSDFGYAAVVVLGDPLYYQRIGFGLAAQYQLYCCWPGCETNFQIFPLAEDALVDVVGLVEYSAPFQWLT